jgi:3D (Asp-Asp-Asp) domain-containing protein
MGTKVRIPELFGDRIFTVRDRMNARHASRVDVWMLSHADAMKFGVKKARIEVVEIVSPDILISKK